MVSVRLILNVTWKLTLFCFFVNDVKERDAAELCPRKAQLQTLALCFNLDYISVLELLYNRRLITEQCQCTVNDYLLSLTLSLSLYQMSVGL